jgi:hypothetical protein
MTWRTGLHATGLALCLSVALNSDTQTLPATPIVLEPVITDAPMAARLAVNDRLGRLYVLTPQDHSVALHDLAGRAIGRIGMVGNGSGELLGPVDLAVLPTGDVWVADKGNNRLQRFDADGRANAQIQVQSPESVAIGPEGDLWVVTTFDRALLRVYTSAGAQLRQIGEPAPLAGMPPAQEGYLSRGRVFAFDDGLIYMFRSLANPKIIHLGRTGQTVREIAIESTALAAARKRATEMEDELRRSGGFRFSSTLNALAIDPARRIIWVCPSAPVLLAYSLATGSKIAEYELRIEHPAGQRVGLQDIVLNGKVAYGAVAKRGVVRFELPTPPNGHP